jgi:hypothetical protein
MEVIQKINPSLQDEHVIAIDPPMKPDQPGVWRRRINAFTGRAVSEKALTAEQDMRAGLQRLHGLSMTSGIVDGLTVLPEIDAIGAAPEKARLQLFAGIGIARSGEDVSIGTTRQFSVGELPVVMPVDIANKLTAAPRNDVISPEALARIATGQPAPIVLPAGLRLSRPMLSAGTSGLAAMPQLRPINLPMLRDGLPMAERLLPDAPRAIAGKLSALVKSVHAGQMPRAAVLVAQPIDAMVMGRKASDCPPDPRDDPYSDLQRIDGTRLLLVMWPQEMTARGTGPDYSLPAITPLRRNQLAYRVFDMERTFQHEEQHPWEAWGVPLALIGFRDDWSLDFVDRASVVRAGGQPRQRTAIVPMSGDEGLWQARINQMIEHLGGLPDLTAETLRATFQRVPPACVLPADIYDANGGKQGFFPSGFGTNAIPVPKSSLELAIKEASGLIPFNLSVADRVEMLVPVPDELYDPGLLTEEKIDGSFASKIERFRKDRNRWLVNREIIRRRYDRLREGVSGIAMAWPAASMPDDEFCPAESTAAPLLVTRTRRYNAAGGARAHSVETAASMTARPGDILWFWLRFHVRPEGVALRVATANAAAPGSFAYARYWGAPDTPEAQTPARKAGELPAASGWVKLEAKADDIWSASNGTLNNFKIGVVEFAQKGGDVEFGPMGKTGSDGRTIIWIGDDVRGKAIFRESANNTTATPGDWDWTPVADRITDLLPDFGTQVVGNASSITAVETFKAAQTHAWLTADIAGIDENGLDPYINDLTARLKATNDAIDVGFVRARSDIYRVRQFMLGADAASRLVTSPSLADLAKRDEGARVTGAGISEFIKKAMEQKTEPFNFATTKLEKVEGPVLKSTMNAMTAEVNVIKAIERATANNVFVMGEVQPMAFMGAEVLAPMSSGTSRTATVEKMARAGRAEMITGAVLGSAAVEKAAAPVSSEFVSAGLTTRQPDIPLTALGIGGKASVPTALGTKLIDGFRMNYTPSDIWAQRPAPGFVERTLSVAERLTPPPSVQALEFAIASKMAVIQTLRGLMQRNNGRPDGVALDGLFVPGYAFKKGGTGKDKNDPDPGKNPPTIGELVDDLVKNTNLCVDVDDVRAKLQNETSKHESDYFTAAVQTIDNAIALMRLVEDRVTVFERILADVTQIRSDIVEDAARALAQLRLIDSEVEEARHDLSTAQSLFEEEQKRIDELDARRKAILANNVTMIAYRRVRETDHRRFAPTLKLGSGLEQTAMAACRREHPDTPQEVSDYVALFRDAPVKYFPRIAAEVKRIDRAEAAAKALERARQQAMLEQARRAAAMQMQVQQMQLMAMLPLFQQHAEKAKVAQHQALSARRIRLASLDIATIPRLSLAQVHQEFGEHATLADAADGTHNAPLLVKMATDLLADVAGVAACLHAEFAETPAAIRLDWAEALSQFDGQVDLQSLASLPQWGRIDRDQRKRLQSLASWLFAMIDRTNPKALALISDLVRITLLLAAHAPVRRLIPARLVGESPARIGTRLMLDVDIRSIRTGMATIIRDRQNRIISRAIIEDMIDGRASARIVHVAPQITTIFPDMRVELSSQIVRLAKAG